MARYLQEVNKVTHDIVFQMFYACSKCSSTHMHMLSEAEVVVAKYMPHAVTK